MAIGKFEGQDKLKEANLQILQHPLAAHLNGLGLVQLRPDDAETVGQGLGLQLLLVEQRLGLGELSLQLRRRLVAGPVTVGSNTEAVDAGRNRISKLQKG